MIFVFQMLYPLKSHSHYLHLQLYSTLEKDVWVRIDSNIVQERAGTEEKLFFVASPFV
jgi:hypothetical protein